MTVSCFAMLLMLSLRKCVITFLWNFYFLPNDSPSKTVNNVFLFHPKSSFCSRDIQIYIFSSSPLFLPVSHYFKAWFKINLNVCDVITCLNQNLKKHFVWYLEKEKVYDTETLSIDRVLSKEHFYGKIMQKMYSTS